MSAYAVKNGENCGAGTMWGCGFIVEYPGRLLLHKRGQSLFHPACWPNVATTPAFSKGLAAEIEAEGR